MKDNNLIDQTLLIKKLLEHNLFTSYEIENSSKYFKSLRDRQWLSIGPDLSTKLIDEGETVLVNKFGHWWWRLTHDNPLETDPILEKLKNAEGVK